MSRPLLEQEEEYSDEDREDDRTAHFKDGCRGYGDQAALPMLRACVGEICQLLLLVSHGTLQRFIDIANVVPPALPRERWNPCAIKTARK